MEKKHKLSWTWKCKNFIVAILSFVIIFILVLISYEIFTEAHNVSIALSLIGIIAIIMPMLGGLLNVLLKHEREKPNKIERKNNDK